MSERLGITVDRVLTAKDPRLEFETAICELPIWLYGAAISAYERGLPMCDSPIEVALFPWLLCQAYSCFRQSPAVLLAGEEHRLAPYTVAVCPQYKIGRRRADFVLAARRAGPVRLVIIECDGRDFHQDVHADVQRDSELLSNPRVLDVHPLTGSEIWRDPRKAGVSAARAFIDAWAKTNRAMDAKFAPEPTLRLAQGAQL